MNTEKKLREAVAHVLEQKMFKSLNQLANVAEVEQASLFRFKNGGGIKIDNASKLIDAIGGVLVFPWDDTDTAKLSAEVARLKNELEKKQEEVIGLRANVDMLKNMIVRDIQRHDDTDVQAKSYESCG